MYSNLGAALLGHALAAAAGTDYATLLDTRVLEPLGMDDAVLVQSPDEVPAEHAGGFTTIGEPVDPCTPAASHRPAPCTRRSTTWSPSRRR